MRFDEYMELPLEELQQHVKAELARNPFIRVEADSLRSALASDARTERRELDLGSGIHFQAVVVDTTLGNRGVSLILTADELKIESRSGRTVRPKHEAPEAAVRQLLERVAECVPVLRPLDSPHYPEEGQGMLWVRTADGILGARAPAAELTAGRSDLSTAFSVALALLRTMVGEAP